MAIQFIPVQRPANLDGKLNGRLPVTVLQSVYFPGYGHRSVHTNAARAWNAFALKFHLATGKTLTVTPGGAYRTYDAQLAAFNTRMSSWYNPLTCTTITRTWNGKTYWLKRGYAPVAVPGTSNHGWGLAFDMAYFAGAGQPLQGVTSNWVAWKWIQDNAVAYGFSWEGAKPGEKGWEPWHIRYVTGDTIPKPVLDLEAFFAAVSK